MFFPAFEDVRSQASRASISPISSDYMSGGVGGHHLHHGVVGGGGGGGGKKLIKDSSSSTFSHDSGVDSMNTNSSGEREKKENANSYLQIQTN